MLSAQKKLLQELGGQRGEGQMLSSLVVCLCFGLRHLTFLTKSSETQYLEFISRLCGQLLTYQDLGGGVQLLLVFRYLISIHFI